MVKEFHKTQLAEVASRFPGAQAQLVLASIIEGNTDAQCWSIGETDQAFLLWDKGNIVFYIAHNPPADAVPNTITDQLANLVTNTIRPRAKAEGLRYFSARALTSRMERLLPQIFHGITLHPIQKRFYSFNQTSADPMPSPRLHDVDFLPIDANLLHNRQLTNVQYVEDEVRWMWTDMHRFQQHGFGVAVRYEDQLICWCTAEYVSHSQCGIGIETVEDFRGKNVATATAARFVAEGLRRNLHPHWECNSNNMASARVAEKVGFNLIEESTFWAGQFPEEEPPAVKQPD